MEKSVAKLESEREDLKSRLENAESEMEFLQAERDSMMSEKGSVDEQVQALNVQKEKLMSEKSQVVFIAATSVLCINLCRHNLAREVNAHMCIRVSDRKGKSRGNSRKRNPHPGKKFIVGGTEEICKRIGREECQDSTYHSRSTLFLLF